MYPQHQPMPTLVRSKYFIAPSPSFHSLGCQSTLLPLLSDVVLTQILLRQYTSHATAAAGMPVWSTVSVSRLSNKRSDWN